MEEIRLEVTLANRALIMVCKHSLHTLFSVSVSALSSVVHNFSIWCAGSKGAIEAAAGRGVEEVRSRATQFRTCNTQRQNMTLSYTVTLFSVHVHVYTVSCVVFQVL